MYGVEFRPLNFDSVLGLGVTKDILKAILKGGSYDPGYLFIGSHSTGKTTLGRIFARSVFCTNKKEDMSPCNTCKSCKMFLENRHPGYLEIDAANNGNKEDIQNIKERLSYESVSDYFIILFDEAHNISTAGKDSLLLQLEKINNNIILLFCTTEPDKMPDTISSRCIQFLLQNPSEKDVRDKLTEICKNKELEYDPEALFTIVRGTGRHYRDAENKLKQVSYLGNISNDNVKKVVSLYDEEITAMLLTLSYDLSKAMQISDFLVSCMNVKNIYENILKIINDSIKFMNGISFDSERYNNLLKTLSKQYGNSLFEVLNYILSKNKLTDLTMFQTDLLILHYKFLRGGFDPQEVKSIEGVKAQESPKDSTKEKGSVIKTIKDIQELPPGEKEDVVRAYKNDRRNQGKDSRVAEKVSDKWGPEVKENVTPMLHKKEVTRDVISKVLQGRDNGEKV